MISWWQATLLGLVQGLTEFLPISSSGHLVLLQEFFNFEMSMVAFDVALHTGTLMAVLVFFWKDLLSLRLKQLVVVAIGTAPVVLGAVFLVDHLDALFSNLWIVLVGLTLTGIINILSDRLLQQPVNTGQGGALDVPMRSSLIVGLAQLAAVVPGISRSGSTVFTGLSLGLNRKTAFRFSFLLSIPAILGANILHMYQSGLAELQSFGGVALVIGMVAALISGFLSLKLLEYMIVSAKIRFFGWYCLTLASLLLFYLLLR